MRSKTVTVAGDQVAVIDDTDCPGMIVVLATDLALECGSMALHAAQKHECEQGGDLSECFHGLLLWINTIEDNKYIVS